MKRLVIAALVAAAAGSVTLTAQSAATPATATPTLVGNISASADDSPLVRAAKATAAARKRAAARSTGVLINDNYMRTHTGGRVSEATGPANYPTVPAPQTASTPKAAPAAPAVDRASLERKDQQLRQEQARAAGEMEEPYGGNSGMEEDRAEQRSTQIPKEIQKNQQQMNPSRP